MATLKLPRLPFAWSEQPGLFERYWDTAMTNIENAINSALEAIQAALAAQTTADGAQTAAGNAQSSADAANAAIAALPVLASGIYTPTLTNEVNVTASTAFSCQWMRVGSTVTVSGRVDVTPTSINQFRLGISLPIPSNLANNNELGGTAVSADQIYAAAIRGDATNDRAQLGSLAGSTSSYSQYFTFTYRII